MAITRAQQARQMYRTAGAVQAAYGDAAAKPGSVERPTVTSSSNDGGNNLQKVADIVGTASDLNRAKNVLTGGGLKAMLPDPASMAAMFVINQIIKNQNKDNQSLLTQDEEEVPMMADGGIMDLEQARQGYKLGKLVKKVTRAAKKVFKSPIGKAALLYTGIGGLGNLASGANFFSNFASPTAFLNKANLANIFSRQGLGNIASRIGLGTMKSVKDPIKDTVIRKFTPNMLGKVLTSPGGIITATSLLPLLGIGTGDETEEEAKQLIADNTGLNFDELRPQGPLRFAADGGLMRMGFNEGGKTQLELPFGEPDYYIGKGKNRVGIYIQSDGKRYAVPVGPSGLPDYAQGGRAGYQEGGDAEPVAKKTMPLIDMDGKEKDYRETGGFVDMGRMERADDVPARLSKNEFVFTADAVRNAGDGDIDKGAEVMYNMMKNLEAGGEVSEESQGLEGARRMFQTSQRLGEVI